MKKESVSIVFNTPEFERDVAGIVSSIQEFGLEGFYFEANFDLMSYAMTELVASKTFAKLPMERKRELFNQYSTLRSILELLQEFVREHPLLSKANLYAISNQ